MIRRKSTDDRKATTTSSSAYSARDLSKIKDRAYFIWLSKGKPANTSSSDWSQAEAEFKRGKLG